MMPAFVRAADLDFQQLAKQLDADSLATRNSATRTLLRIQDARAIPALVHAARGRRPEGVDRAVHVLQEYALGDNDRLSDAAFIGLRQAAEGRDRSPAHVALTEYHNRLVAKLKPKIDALGGTFTVNFNGSVAIALNSDWRGTADELKQFRKLHSVSRFSIERSALADHDLQYLKGLKASHLYFGETKVTAKGLRMLGEMPATEYLSLRRNRLGGLRSDDLQGFSALRTLALDDTDVTSEDLKAVGRVSSLWTLDLLNAQHVSDQGLKHLAELPALRSLQLNGTQVTGEGFAGLEFPLLETLRVKGCPITSKGIMEICKFKTLKTLGLDHTSASDDDMRIVADLPVLQTLWLSKSKVTDAGIGALGRAKSLSLIYVHGAAITSLGRRALQEQLPNCRVEGVMRNTR